MAGTLIFYIGKARRRPGRVFPNVNSNNQQAPSNSGFTSYDLIFDPLVVGGEDNLTILSNDILSFDPSDDVGSWNYLGSVDVNEITIEP